MTPGTLISSRYRIVRVLGHGVDVTLDTQEVVVA